MALDPIVRGADWDATITVGPTSGQTDADVTTALTGASVALRLFLDDSPVVTGTGSVIDAALRTITIGFSAAVTTTIPTLDRHQLDILLTTTEPKVRPIRLVNGPNIPVKAIA